MLSHSRLVLEVEDQASFCPCAPREVSVLTELALGHLRCCLADMPPQPNSPSQSVSQQKLTRPRGARLGLERGGCPRPEAPARPASELAVPPSLCHEICRVTIEEVVFQGRVISHL